MGTDIDEPFQIDDLEFGKSAGIMRKVVSEPCGAGCGGFQARIIDPVSDGRAEGFSEVRSPTCRTEGGTRMWKIISTVLALVWVCADALCEGTIRKLLKWAAGAVLCTALWIQLWPLLRCA